MHRAAIFAGAFAVIYALCLAIGLAAGFALKRGTGVDIGAIVNIVGFLLSVHLADKAAVQGQASVDVAPRLPLAVLIAVLATVVDIAVYAAASLLLTGAFRPFAPLRLLGMAAAYGGISYVLMTYLQSRREAGGEAIVADLAAQFRALSPGDRSVLLTGMKHPGSPMLTTRGSPNDRYWRQLARLDWTAPAPLPEGIPAARHVAWTVTRRGAEMLPRLVRYAR